MADLSATGFSVAGYQVLIQAPHTFRRAFVQLDGVPSGLISYRGAIAIEFAFGPSLSVGFTYDVAKLWGQAVMFVDIPQLVEGVNSAWFVTANWREAGLEWSVFIDDA